MKLNLKDNKAITLISLVVTIIVLLILAGISISMLAGDNSILQKATEAKTNTDNAQAKEELQLAISGAGVDYYSGKVQNTSQTFRDYIFSNDGQTSINSELPENATFNSSSNEITYKRITFIVADDGTLSISTPLVFDELPDDFWIADNGTAYINTKYIDMTNSDIDSYGSYGYGSYGSSTLSTVGVCQYTKLTVPSKINGETVTKFSVANVNNIVALDIEDGITELANLLTILDTLQTVKKPSSLTIPTLEAGKYVNYRNSGSPIIRYKVLYDINSSFKWTEIVCDMNGTELITLGNSDSKVSSSDFDYAGMNDNIRKAAASYNRVITTLNEATQKYLTDFGDRIRCIGSNPENPNDIEGTTYTSELECMINLNNKFKVGDENYLSDINQLQTIGNISIGHFWLASRKVYPREDVDDVEFGVRYYGGTPKDMTLVQIVSANNFLSGSMKEALVPVVRLKGDVKVAGGKGTLTEPYELGRYTVIEK